MKFMVIPVSTTQFVVADMENSSEVCVVQDYEGRETSAEQDAENIARLLNEQADKQH